MKTSEEIIKEIERRITEMRLDSEFTPPHMVEIYLVGESVLSLILEFIKEDEKDPAVYTNITSGYYTIPFTGNYVVDGEISRFYNKGEKIFLSGDNFSVTFTKDE